MYIYIYIYIYIHTYVRTYMKRLTMNSEQNSHDESVTLSSAGKRSLDLSFFSFSTKIGLKDAGAAPASFKPTFVLSREKLRSSDRFPAEESVTGSLGNT